MARPTFYLAFAPHDLRRIPDEERQIDAALRPLERAGRIHLEVKATASVDQILDALQDPLLRERLAVFHFAGHADAARLLLETPAGGRAEAYGEGLARLFRDLPQLMLVFLNGCATAGHLARLRAAGLPAAIVTTESIADGVAAELAARFYRALAAGASIPEAFAQAEATLLTQHGDDRATLCRSFVPEHHADRLPWKLWIDPAHMARVATWRLRKDSLRTRFRRPLARLGIGATITALVATAGRAALHSRETLLGVPEALDYRLSVVWTTSLDLVATLISAMLFVPFSGAVVLQRCAWLAMGLLALLGLAHRHRHRRWLPLVTACLVGLVVLFGLRVYKEVVFPRPVAGAVGPRFDVHPGDAKPAAASFEVVSWMHNDDRWNEDRRLALFGLGGWLLVVAVANTGHALGLRGRHPPARWLAAGALAMLTVHTAIALPRAYAISRWGLAYPTLAIDESCRPVPPGWDERQCCLFDVSAGGRPTTTLMWGLNCPEKIGFQRWPSAEAECFVGQQTRVIQDDC